MILLGILENTIMNNLVTNFRKFIRAWLGLDDIYMGVDFGYKDRSSIIIMSKSGKGIIKIVDCEFGSIVEVERLAHELQLRYGISDRNVFKDRPYDFRSL